MKKIAVVTTTRAEYGLLSPIIKKLRANESDDFKLDLIVGGTHLDERYGHTIDEIISDGVRVNHEITIKFNSDSEVDVANNQAQVLVEFTKLFASEKYKAVIILGDRYEMLMVAVAAMNTRTPIFHISGGDITEGAIDDCIRHAITKMSYLHFTTNEDSRKRVIQLGEEPSRVFNYGSTSIDNVIELANMSKHEVMESMGISNENFAVCTYHPVTLENGNIEHDINEFLSAIKMFPEIDFVVTKSNADQGGDRINVMLDEADKQISNLHIFSSLGAKRYLSVMKHSLFVLGNSSSGIVETPAFHIPTVNIGDRQRGRLQAGSIINCGTSRDEIVKAINIALSKEFREKCKKVKSLYGDGNSADRVAQKVIEYLAVEIDLKKKFYNIDYNKRFVDLK